MFIRIGWFSIVGIFSLIVLAFLWVFLWSEIDLGWVDEHPSTLETYDFSDDRCWLTIRYMQFDVNDYVLEHRRYPGVVTPGACECLGSALFELGRAQQFAAYPDDHGDWRIAVDNLEGVGLGTRPFGPALEQCSEVASPE